MEQRDGERGRWGRGKTHPANSTGDGCVSEAVFETREGELAPDLPPPISPLWGVGARAPPRLPHPRVSQNEEAASPSSASGEHCAEGPILGHDPRDCIRRPSCNSWVCDHQHRPIWRRVAAGDLIDFQVAGHDTISRQNGTVFSYSHCALIEQGSALCSPRANLQPLGQSGLKPSRWQTKSTDPKKTSSKRWVYGIYQRFPSVSFLNSVWFLDTEIRQRMLICPATTGPEASVAKMPAKRID